MSRRKRMNKNIMVVEPIPLTITPLGLVRAIVVSPNARIARFVLTGGLAGFAQLILLTLFTDHGWHAIGANAVAFLLAAQLNFALSSIFTWPDRHTGQSIRRRWLIFHGSIAGMAVVNMAVFAAMRLVLPDLAASAAGICVAAIGNFLIGDRLVFRAPAVGEPGPIRRARKEVAA
jgi:putative flippase GtrA